ncbi:hypothetical protein R6Q57_029742 [Mikania cordata]
MNPRPNNLNPEFNPFSYNPESLRNLYAQLQQNPNIQHFQPNFQPHPNFQPGFAAYSQPRFESDFVSPSQPDNEVVSETQDTQKRKKGKKNKQPAGGICNWGRVFSGVTIVGVKGFQWGDDVARNFSEEGFSVR